MLSLPRLLLTQVPPHSDAAAAAAAPPRRQVRAASPDTLDVVGQLTPVFLQEIGKTFTMNVASGEQREKQAELQGQLCGVLQVRAEGGASCSRVATATMRTHCCCMCRRLSHTPVAARIAALPALCTIHMTAGHHAETVGG